MAKIINIDEISNIMTEYDKIINTHKDKIKSCDEVNKMLENKYNELCKKHTNEYNELIRKHTNKLLKINNKHIYILNKKLDIIKDYELYIEFLEIVLITLLIIKLI